MEIEEKKLIRISVRNLVEFILRSGDIDNRYGGGTKKEAMQEGSRIHRKIQRRMGASYHAEVSLKYPIETEYYLLSVEGRADGIILEEGKMPVIDEIKGVYQNLNSLEEPIGVHTAQAMCYAYIYAAQNKQKEIGIQMTYCNLDTEEIKRFSQKFAFEDLKTWFDELTNQYRKWADFQYEWRQVSIQTIQKLQFPFPYRTGQKELASDVYRTILRKKNLFIQAPTGVGKTLSTLFPAVKACGAELAEKIFYLTAKTITGTVAKETFELFREQGYRGKVIQITAKEKMCLCEEMECNPGHCPYAKGHYDRVNDAVFEIINQEDVFTREVIEAQAEKWQVCPFELGLDIASWCDDIICDYNYVYDPNVYLKRFFAEGVKGDYLFLVDEAHNLVERGRQMYSAELYKEDFLAVRKIVKPLNHKVVESLSKCNKILLEYKRECDTYRTYEDDISVLIFALMRLGERLDFFLQKAMDFPERKTVVDFYMNLRNFLNRYESMDEHYVIYTEHDEQGAFKIKLYCVDPSFHLQECINKGRATVFFSATLLPIQYYKELLSTKADNYAVYAQTSFTKDQKLLLIAKDVSSKYNRRGALLYQNLADYIEKTVRQRCGNYMVFFPSYRFLQDVYEIFISQMPTHWRTLRQETGMGESQREDFLAAFSEENEAPLVAFCVMGGIFSEGIDLKEEKLIGALIVGTGLPQINHEQDILKTYYDKKTGQGFDYAYRYPGMNKVLQSAGRVIRTLQDYGIIELLDDRFLQRDYQKLFPREWQEYKICAIDTVEQRLSEFWQQF